MIPPKAPAGVVEAPLLEAWRRVDTHWHARLDKLQDSLESTAKSQGRLKEAFSRLAGALLGFGRTHRGLLEDVAGKKMQTPSAVDPATARNLFSELEALEKQAQTLQGDLDEAERKAREDEAREKQEREWQARIVDAKERLCEKRKDEKAKNDECENLDKQVKAIEEEKKNASDDEKKNLYAKEKKLSDELKQCKKQLSSLRDEIRSLDETTQEKFHFRPPVDLAGRSKQSTGRFGPQAPATRSSFDVPDEGLPSVGALRVFKGQRYLVIETWEELNIGEQEAERLQAQLVARD